MPTSAPTPKILVTGAAGFLGAHVASRLIGNGCDVVGLDMVPPDEAWRLDVLGLRDPRHMAYRWGNVLDVRSLDGFTHVVHCAAATDVANAALNPMSAAERTVGPTIALLEAAKAAKSLRRFVLVSTHSVYGTQPTQPIPEDALPMPGNLYGALKVAQEQAAMAYHRSFGLPVEIVRSATLFGAHIRAGALVRVFLERAWMHQMIGVSGDGLQSRDLNHVENTVDGIVAALDRIDGVGGTFNLGSGEDVSILSLAERCIALMGGGWIEHGPPRPGEEGRLALDLSMSRRVLGYSPGISVDAGLEMTADWVRKRLERLGGAA